MKKSLVTVGIFFLLGGTLNSALAVSSISEAKNAAAAGIGTQNFIVGRMARDCAEPLKKTDNFVQDFTNKWIERNSRYVEASKLYLQAYVLEMQLRHGTEGKEQAIEMLNRVIRGQGRLAVKEMFEKGTPEEVCNAFISAVDNKKFDVAFNHRLTSEIKELVQAFDQTLATD